MVDLGPQKYMPDSFLSQSQYGGIEDDQYSENSTRISDDPENNVNVDLSHSKIFHYLPF